MAGVSKPLSEFSNPFAVYETHASDRRGHAGAHRCVGHGLLRKSVRHLLFSASTHLACHHAEEVPWPMRIGMGLLAAVCLALGLAPMLAVPIIDRVAASMIGSSIADKMLALDGWALHRSMSNFRVSRLLCWALSWRQLWCWGLGLSRLRRHLSPSIQQDLGMRAQFDLSHGI